VKFDFCGPLWYWRGPAPWYFVTVPPAACREIKAIAHTVTYGWGMIPAEVRIGKTVWQTALWPKDGSYVVPVKSWVRQAEELEEGQEVTVHLTI
jgi:hypothetical protein